MRREQVVRLIAREVVARRAPHEKLAELALHWCWDEDDEEWPRLPLSVREEIARRGWGAPPYLWRSAYDAVLELLEEGARRAVRSEWLLAEARSLGLQVDGVEGEPEPHARCPCCGYRTLPRRGYYDVCDVCQWEDAHPGDAFEDTAPSVLQRYSAPNHMTREQYRATWEARRQRDLASGDPERVGLYEKFPR